MSRSTRPSPFGKRTHEVRTRISEETSLVLAEKWRSLGYKTEAEFLAELIEVTTHGLPQVRRLQEERLCAIAGIGKESGEKVEDS